MSDNLVDAHAHVFTPEGPYAANARYRPDYHAPLATLQAAWRGSGDARAVTHGVLIQPSFYGTDNTKLLAALDADPRRLRGVVVVDVTVSRVELDALHARGVRGIRHNLVGADHRVAGSDRWQRVYRDVAGLGWHVEVHTEPGVLPRVLDALADCAAPVVVDHFGRPDPALGLRCATFDALAAFAARRQVFVKLSGAYRNAPADCAPYAARLLATLGPGRLMWASDWPWTGFEDRGFRYGDFVAELARWVPDPAMRRTVAWDTPARVFGFAP
ncbi:MAG: amidohydrolase family protein [Burkholderiales bacterium]